MNHPKQYNVISGTALRNSVQWMHDFLCTMKFHYYCNICESTPSVTCQLQEFSTTKDLVAVKQSLLDQSNKLEEVTSSLDILRDDIRSKVSITLGASALRTMSSSATNVPNPHTPSYADIVASNMVKTVVTQSLMEQC